MKPAKAKAQDLTQNWTVTIVSGLIFFSAFLVYLPGVNNGFIYDDKFLILRNPAVTQPQSWKRFFFREFYQMPGAKSSYYRPLVNFSYWLNYQFAKESPRGYHFFNLFLHSLVSIMVFFSFKLWSKNLTIAGMTGLLFAFHPAHTQSVCWISGRTDILFSFFALLSFYFYLRSKAPEPKINLAFCVLSWICFLFSLFSKETALMILVLFILTDFLRSKSLKSLFSFQKLFIYFGFLSAMIIYFIFRFKAVGYGLGEKSPEFSEWYYQNLMDVSRIVTIFKVYFYYLQTLIYPVHLCFESKMLVSRSWVDPRWLGGLVGMLTFLGLGLFCWKKFPFISLGVFWFFLGLLPVANIIPFRELAMEHLLYFPSVGFCLILAFIFYRVLEGTGWKKILTIGILSVLLGSYTGLTVSRQKVWKNELVFWRDSVLKAPLKRRPWYNYGIRLREKGDARGALRAWEMAVRAEPDDADVHNNLGAAYFEMGDLEQAVQEFEKALRINPSHPRARVNLENVLRLKNQALSHP